MLKTVCKPLPYQENKLKSAREEAGRLMSPRAFPSLSYQLLTQLEPGLRAAATLQGGREETEAANTHNSRDNYQRVLAHARQLAPGEQTEDFIRGALELCQQWATDQRWYRVLDLARTCQELASRCDIEQRYHVACAYGTAQADRFELTGAIEAHAVALQLAQQIEPGGDAVAQAWNNLGRTFAYGGAYELAITAFSRALTGPEQVASPLTLYTTYANLAQCHFYRAETQAGLAAIQQAEALGVSPFSTTARDWLPLRHSQVRLLIQAGQIDAAAIPVGEISQYAAFAPSLHKMMVEQAASGIHAVARGVWQTGLRQMQQALNRSRVLPGALRDMLMSVVQAEKLAGRPQHAAYYDIELKDHNKQAMIEALCRSNAVLRAAL